MQHADTRDAVRQRGEAKQCYLDGVTQLILDLGFVWQAPDVYEHRDNKWSTSEVSAEGVAR